MSVATWFEKCCTNLRMSETTVSDISHRYKRLTKQLNKDFWTTDSETAHSLYAGSYGRDTGIHVGDIDMLFQLPYSVYQQYNAHTGNGQSAFILFTCFILPVFIIGMAIAGRKKITTS